MAKVDVSGAKTEGSLATWSIHTKSEASTSMAFLGRHRH